VPGPTNRMAAVRPADEDPRDVILRELEEAGCTCEWVQITEQEITPEVVAAAIEHDAVRATNWEVRHEPSCVLLAKQSTN
jgi:hypothetical protein